MSKELDVATDALRCFIEKANAAFPDIPEVTLTFSTQASMNRFRAQLRADTPPIVVAGWYRLPPGIEAEYNGVRIRLKLRT